MKSAQPPRLEAGPCRSTSAVARRCGAALAAGLLGASLAGCGAPAHSGQVPEVSLAGSAEAQREFRALHEQWVATPPDGRATLETALTRFVQAHPSDPQGRRARTYLAWMSVQRGQLELAERWLGLAETGSAGSAHDLAEVVRASIDLERGRPELAYVKLLDLQGRLIDGDDRLLCLEQLVRAALASGQHAAAVEHVLELAAQGARRHRERLWRTLSPHLRAVPADVLESSLRTLSPSSIESASVRPAERAAAVDWMRRQIVELLSRSALAAQDVELAQRLVAAPPGDSTNARDQSQLLLLATRGGLQPSVVGRTIGLVLQLDDAVMRQRSMDLAAGIALSLDLAEAAPDPARVSLATRQVDEAGMAEAVTRLAGEGATLLAAGLDAQSARAAVDVSRRHGLAVLLLSDPGIDPLPPGVAVLGADHDAARRVLGAALGERGGMAELGSAELPCPEAGEGVTPEWLAAGHAFRSLLISGTAACARGVLAALPASSRRWLLGVGLSAWGLLGDGGSPHEVWTLKAGQWPLFEHAADPTLERWLEHKGRTPSWYEALGHDLAQVADAVLPPAPDSIIRDPKSVSQVHGRVRSRLAQASFGALWTSNASRFGADRRLPREFRVVKVPARGDRAEGGAPAAP